MVANRMTDHQSMSMERARAPSPEEIELIADAAYHAIPAPLQRLANAVQIRVEEFPDEETLDAMDMESPYDLLGLYSGIPLDEQSVGDVRQNVDLIFLYRRPLLDYWVESGETLEAVVRHVLIHEIGHHFGLSDSDMERIERAN
jgi:predicted Zn-dependent protease with MMP-like domain